MTGTERVYGDALYDLALEEGLTDVIGGQLSALRQSFREEPGFLKLLSEPSIPKAERLALIGDSFDGTLHQYLLSFLKLLTEQGRIRAFDGCCGQFKLRYDEDNGIVPVRAVTAVALSQALRTRLEEKLRDLNGKTPDVTYVVDPDCLGGVLLDLDGSRLDGTVRHRLEDMKQVLRNTVL